MLDSSKAGLQDFTWHCLRHTFASRLIMAGVDLRTAQELMGHKTIQMTCRYAHLAPKHQLAAVERLCKAPDKPKSTRTAHAGLKIVRKTENGTPKHAASATN